MDTGAIISALSVTSLAGAFSLFNLLVTKDQKISEFRQAWIEDVRTDLSELVAQAQLISGYIKTHVGKIEADEFVKATADNYIKINEADTRVRLRMNRKEPLHSDLLKTMDDMAALLDIGKYFSNTNGYQELNGLTAQITERGADLLKAEWERVKKGERLYRTGKWLTGVVLLFSFLALLYVLLISHGEQSLSAPNYLYRPI